MANTLKIARLAVLTTVSVFGLIAMGMGGALTPYVFLVTPAGLAIATGIFTLLTLPAMVAVEWLKPGVFFTSTVIFEAIWLGILSVLWLSTGGTAATVNAAFSALCDHRQQDAAVFNGFGDSDGQSQSSASTAICDLPHALAAFGFLNWIFLFFYVVAIIILACMASSRKQPKAWTGTVENLLTTNLNVSARAPGKDIETSSYGMYPPGAGTQVQTGSV
uniref:MARVEL domain-containing protein n=1 Tax=Mycena chlorophos TaxID=658473 RepID=A0ABQ0M020_MYCCL|nr:predicted protein [Mycena chlorophos]